jgi:diaminopimelate decarboxylase
MAVSLAAPCRTATPAATLAGVTDELLLELAERHGTPLYVYDLDQVAARVAALRAALPGARLRYAVKANAAGALLARLAGAGVGAEVITVGELARALRAGIPASETLLSGPGQDADLRRLARDADVGLASLDGADPWRAWREALPPTTRFLVRVRPGFDPGTLPQLATGAEDAKFGLPPARALELAREVAAAGRLAGLHVHAGSMIADVDVHLAALASLDPLLDALPPARWTVDAGGGWAVPDFDLVGYAERVGDWAARRGVDLIVEPGRWLTAEAGVLLTRVLWRKGDRPVHWICDAGMAQLLRPALYGAEHPVRVVRPAGAPAGVPGRGDVDGPLCENADRLARDRELDARPGDLLAIERAGAYGMGMASNYASELRPAEVAVEDGVARLVRLRETPEDLWRLEDAARPTPP